MLTRVSTSTQNTKVSRRAVARGAAWAAPTVLVAVAAPSIAASLRKDPGINGWVNNNYRAGTCNNTNSRITVQSNASGVTPDGAPFGLYLYDTEDVQTVNSATITYWVLGVHDTTGNTAITWSTNQGHSNCWRYDGRVGTQVKPDGLTYTGYRWTYTCTINPKNTTIGSDGVARVFLGTFHVSTNDFRQPQGSCGKLNFWTERSIVIDGVTYAFQRRNGTDGPMSAPVNQTGARAAGARSAEAPVASDGGGEPVFSEPADTSGTVPS